MPLQAVLFDLDDTLLDHAPCRQNAWRALRKDYPAFALAPLEQLVREQAELFRSHYPLILSGEWTPEESVKVSLCRMGERYGLRWDADQTEQVVRCFFSAYESEWVPVAGVVPLLQALHPLVVLGVVTNGLHASQWAKLEAAGLAGYFRFMTAPDTADGALKPDPYIYQKALIQAGATVDAAVFVGDLWETDIQGAHNAGMRALWYNPTRQICPNPEWVRDTMAYEPLAPILEWLNAAG